MSHKYLLDGIFTQRAEVKDMLVRDYMTPDPKILRLTDTLKDAARLFYKYKINGAPVVDENDVVCGLITNSHIILAVINDLPFSAPVSAVMTRNVITVSPDNTLEEAWQIPVGRLPVVSADNKLVGMLTRTDFLGAFYNQMRHAQDELQAIIRSTHNGIIVINAYGLITVFNEAAARLLGVPPGEAIGRFVTDVIPDTGLHRVLLTGQSETDCHLTVNGQTLLSSRSPIFEGSKIIGALAIIQDTSEIRYITRQLADKQHQAEALEAIFESAKQGIVVVDKDGIITKVNQSYEDIFGVSREELIGRPAEEAIENTRLHVVIQTGVPELGVIQNYKGRQIIVNRVPVFQNGVVVGAIGEVIFRDISELELLIKRLNLLEHQVSRYEQELTEMRGSRYTFADIIGRSRAIVQVKNLAAKAALTDSNVLITGESGTGKELFAHAIHSASHRSRMPFVCVNCAAIPMELLETELFGYEEGAFTGAKKGGKPGKFELANNGTLFLDEIGDMPLAMQAKLLRVIQDKTFNRVGGTATLTCDVRIIAATNKPLAKLVREKMFREDLYYRLNVFPLAVPPLRERREDIGELIAALFPKICRRLGAPVKEFSPEALAALRAYDWPGNVRELINVLEQLAATVNSALITPRQLPLFNLAKTLAAPAGAAAAPPAGTEQMDRDRIAEVLRYTKGNKSLAAKLLGVHRSTLYEKMKKYNLE